MNIEEVRPVLERMIKETFFYEGDLVPDMLTTDIQGWDSLGTMEMVMAIEEEFSIEIPIGMIPELDKIGKILEFIVDETSK